MEETDNKDISKYNEAALQIQRLHNLWLKTELLINNGELTKVKYLLDSVWRELVADSKERADDPKITEIKNQILKNKIILSKTEDELYKNLSDRIEFLKLLQDEVGKGGVYLDESKDDFE